MTEYKVTVNDDGTERWRLHGKLHRENGPAVTYADGTKYWYKNGEYHREGGPAIIYASGAQFWYKEDTLHREDGPAIIYANSDKKWYLNGQQLTEEVHTKRTQLVKELSISELESMLGYKVKIVKKSK